MANIIESRVTLEDEVFEETIDTMEEPIEVVRPSSYEDLEDLPQVNGVTLIGNKTSEELGIVTATDIENAVSAEATLRENADTALGGRIDGEKTARENADTALGGRIDGEITNRTNADNALGTRIDNEILARQGGDNNLQTQIDAITSKSDVVDVVADYAALQAYDTQHLGNNDVIKVLDDETHNDAQTYYRWNKTAGTWSYIGSEAPYYSKGQIDQQMQAKQDKLTAGTGISLDGATISADTTVLATKEDLEPEIVADLPTVGDTTKLYLTPTNKTASGNPITIDLKEDVGQMTSFRLDGDTFQQSYTGKNLCRITLPNTSTAVYSDNTITLNGYRGTGNLQDTSNIGTRLVAGTYTVRAFLLSGSASGNGTRFIMRFGDNVFTVRSNISGVSEPLSVTLDSDTDVTLQIWVDSPTTYDNLKIGYQIESGSTATTYEPYVGGTYSPNPGYPQAIQTVTGTQTVEVVGKNLFDIDSIITGYELISATGEVRANADWWVTPLIPVKAGEAYTSSNMRVLNKVFYNENGDFVSTITAKTATAPADARYMRMNAKLTDIPNYVGKAQLELGSTATTYTPYSKQTLPISLGSIELCKLGTYQDYIYKSGSDWKVHKATNKAILDGSSFGGWALTTGATGYTRADTASSIGFPSYDGYCDKLTTRTGAHGGYEYIWFQPEATGRIYIQVMTSRLSDNTIEGFNSWLNDAKPTAYYTLSTPTDTTITDQTLIAQLEAVRKATLANGQNTITNVATGANLAGSMSIGYYGYNPSEYSEWLYVDGAWEQVSGRPIPTKTSDLENDSDYATRDEVATKLQAVIVDELPTMGDEGKLYLTPKNYTTGTATGNPITISLGEDAGQITSFQLDGDTYQQSYTGKNLLGASLATMQSENTRGTWSNGSYTQYGVTVTPVFSNGLLQRIELSGMATSNFTFIVAKSYSKSEFEAIVTAGETYTLSGCPSGGSPTTYYLRVLENPYKNLYTDTGEGITKQMPSISSGATQVRLVIGIDSGTNTTGLVYRPQFEKSASVTAYEPYVGGVPSPNPDYPQAVNTVTGEQTVTVVGKNLFDETATPWGEKVAFNDAGEQVRWTGYVGIADYQPVVSNTTYAFSNSLNKAIYYGLVFYDADKNKISFVTSSTRTFTTPANCAYIRFSIQSSTAPTWTQLELGSTATTYQPYSSNDYEINLNCNIYDRNLAYMSGNDMQIPVDITPGSSYYYGATTRWVGVYLYDASGTLIRTVGHTATTRSGSFTAASNEVKAVFTFYAGPDVTWSWPNVEFYDLAGVIELCKLGTYQDYIYKSGDDWKVHKATNKITVNGSENWQYPDSGANYTFFQFSRNNFISKYGNAADFYASITEVGFAKADKFEQIVASSVNMRTEQGIGFTTEGSGWFRISVPNTVATTLDAFKTWLGSNNVAVYYALETPTDTTITDQTLIAQLEAVRNATLQASNTITNTATGTNLAGDLELGYYEYDPTNRYDKWLWLDLNNNYEKLGS